MSEKKNRTRAHCVKVRMNDAEYEQFIHMVSLSGQTQQSYIMAAIAGIKSTTPEEIEILKRINDTTSGVYRNIRGIGSNINQMAKHANETGYTGAEDIKEARLAVQEIKDEVHPIWQSLKLLIRRLQGTQR